MSRFISLLHLPFTLSHTHTLSLSLSFWSIIFLFSFFPVNVRPFVKKKKKQKRKENGTEINRTLVFHRQPAFFSFIFLATQWYVEMVIMAAKSRDMHRSSSCTGQGTVTSVYKCTNLLVHYTLHSITRVLGTEKPSFYYSPMQHLPSRISTRLCSYNHARCCANFSLSTPTQRLIRAYDNFQNK